MARQRMLITLPAGTPFVTDTGIVGVLLKRGECSCKVRIDRPERDVEFQDRAGAVRSFRARRNITTTWAPATLVTPVPSSERTDAMKKKTTTKKTTTKKAASAKQAPAKKGTAKKATAKKAAPKKAAAKKTDGKKMSQLDAAAKVLGEAKEPLNTKTMVERMAAKGYWTSPGGKTPHATLYSAILREINAKGKDARFQKTDRGHFTLNK